jgi:hypothetical protein
MVDITGSTAYQLRSAAPEVRAAGANGGSSGASGVSGGSSTTASAGNDENPVTKILDRYKTVPYLSPRVRVDDSVNRVILEYRNPDTGDVERQYPSKEQIQKYQQVQQSTAKPDEGKKVPDQAPTNASSPGLSATVAVPTPDKVPAPVAATASSSGAGVSKGASAAHRDVIA